MVIGLVGRGYWAKNYRGVLEGIGVSFWQEGRGWKDSMKPDGLIVASSSESHYEVAKEALQRGIPVLVEKPVCMRASEARELVSLGGIALAGHTRLYAPHWASYKAICGQVRTVEAWAGGVNETNPDANLNWWVHLAAMCFDLGFDPRNAVFHVTEEKQPLKFVVNGRHKFVDGGPGALANLVGAFMLAIAKGEPDNSGLRLGLKTLEFVEDQCRSRITRQ